MSMHDLKVIWDKIDTPKPGDGGCWNWIKSTCSSGYGQLRVDGVDWLAHRYVAWALKGLKKDSGLLVRHMCHNPRCCNPNHLLLGTSRDNYHDSIHSHRLANAKKAKQWKIGEFNYDSSRHARDITGISMNTLVKYTNKDTRVFDISGYREACKKAKVIPKI